MVGQTLREVGMARSCAALSILTTGLLLVACTPEAPDPLATKATPAINANATGPATPPFNNEIILRDVTGAGGFGHVKFRQPKDDQLIVYLDTWVRDLAPNKSYRLQRAVDTNIDDHCTGTGWLTLG